MSHERDLIVRFHASTERLTLLSTGFDRRTLELAGIVEDVDRDTDLLEHYRENEVERPWIQGLDAAEAERRRRCPDHLYERLYG